MSKFKRAENILDTIELMGYWWIPDDSDTPKKLSGTLTFQTDGKSQLVLLGVFEEDILGGGRRYDVIVGECHPGRYVTIFDSVNIGSTGPLGNDEICKTTISVNNFWVGDACFSKKSDIQFKSFSFGINNLEKWHDARCFHSNVDEKWKEIELKYTAPEPITIFEDDNVEISLNYNKSSPHSCLGQVSASIEQFGRIFIQSKTGKLPYYGKLDSYDYYFSVIYSFWGLLIGHKTFPYDYQGVYQSFEWEGSEGKHIPGITLEYHYRQSISETRIKQIEPHEMLFQYRDIHDEISVLLKRYFEQYKKNAVFIDELVGFRNEIKSYTRHTLPELVYLFEGLESSLYKTQNRIFRKKQADAESYKKMHDSILATCNEQQREWIAHRLDYYAPLYDRFMVAFSEMKEIFPYFTEELMAKMIKYLKGKRDDHSHSKGQDFTNFELDLNTARWLSLCLIAMLISSCGLSKEKVYKCFTENHTEYNWVKQVILNLLPLENNQKA